MARVVSGSCVGLLDQIHPVGGCAGGDAAVLAVNTWIAACCIVNRVPLATFNAKDFTDFARHDGLVLEDMTKSAVLMLAIDGG